MRLRLKSFLVVLLEINTALCSVQSVDITTLNFPRSYCIVFKRKESHGISQSTKPKYLTAIFGTVTPAKPLLSQLTNYNEVVANSSAFVKRDPTFRHIPNHLCWSLFLCNS